MAVLFCFCAPAWAGNTVLEAYAPSEIVFNVDYHIQYGEKLHLLLTYAEGDVEKTQMDADIAGGTYQTSAQPGTYKFVVSGDKPGQTIAQFTVRANEFWVWNLTDPSKIPSFNFYPTSPVTVKNEGPLRADPILTASAGRYTPGAMKSIPQIMRPRAPFNH